MHRPWRSLALLALTLSVALAGCAPAAPPAPAPPAPGAAPDEPATITFGVYEFNRPLYEPLVERFHAANPDVRVQLVNVDDVASGPAQESAAIARGLAGAADVFSGFAYGDDLVALGIARDLRPFLDADAALARDDFFPGAIVPNAEGAIAMLPTLLDVPLYAYHRDLWARAGLQPPDPGWGWADVRAAAERLTQRGGGEVAVYGIMVFSYEGALGATGLVDLAPLLAAPPAEVRLDDPALVAAATELAGLYSDGVIFTPPMRDEVIYSEDYMPLLTESRIGMWRVGNDNGEELPFAIGYAAVPPAPTGGDLFWRGGLHMSARTRHPEAAWRWMAFVSAEGMPRGQFASFGEIPARRSVADRDGVWARLGDEAAAAVRATFERASAVSPLAPAQQEVISAFGRAVGAMVDEGQSAAQALSAAQARLDERLGELAAAAVAPVAPVAAVATPRPAIALGPDVAVARFYAPGQERQWEELAYAFRERFPQYAVELIKPSDAIINAMSLAELAPHADCFIDWQQPAAADAAALLDLGPLADADPSFAAADFAPGLLDRYRQGGRLLGLPAELLPNTIGYNADAFAAAGLEPPAASWTLDDFIAAAEALTEGEGDERRYGFVPMASLGLQFFIARSGAAALLGSGASRRPNYTDPAVRDAAARYLAVMDEVGPTNEIFGYGEGRTDDGGYDLVQQGRAAMWLSIGFDRYGLGGGFAYDFAPLPLGGAPLGPDEMMISGYFIAAGAASPEACWAWLSFLSADHRAAISGIPARTSVATSPGYLERLSPRQVELAQAYTDALAPLAGRELGSYIGYEGYWLLRAVDRAAQGADLDAELAEAQRHTEAYLACVAAGARARACAIGADPTYDGWLPE